MDVLAINSGGFRVRGLNTGCTSSGGIRNFLMPTRWSPQTDRNFQLPRLETMKKHVAPGTMFGEGIRITGEEM